MIVIILFISLHRLSSSTTICSHLHPLWPLLFRSQTISLLAISIGFSRREELRFGGTPLPGHRRGSSATYLVATVWSPMADT